VVSQDADLFKLVGTVFYDPLILTSSGELILEPGTFPVEDAVNAYLKNLPFNGVFSQTALVDAIQAASGVNDFVITSTQYQLGVSGWVNTGRLYQTSSGFIRVSTASGETLADTLTYQSGD